MMMLVQVEDLQTGKPEDVDGCLVEFGYIRGETPRNTFVPDRLVPTPGNTPFGRGILRTVSSKDFCT